MVNLFHEISPRFKHFTARSLDGDSKCLGVAEIYRRLRAAPWGSASTTTSDDDWAVLQFIELLSVPDGMPAKMMILGDFTGAFSRWDALRTLFEVTNPFERFNEDEGQEADAILGFILAGLLPKVFGPQELIVGDPDSAGLFGKRRIRKQFFNRYGDLNAMFTSIINLMVLSELEPVSDPRIRQWTLELSSRHEPDPNPFIPILDVFERGVAPDWINWQYVNFQGDVLGPMPEALLD